VQDKEQSLMAKKKRGRSSGGFGGMNPGMGGGGMGNLMSQVAKLQEEMEKTQAELAEEELTITAGGGMVTVVVTGAQAIRSIKIQPEAVDPDDVEMLEDLVLAAVTEALDKANALQEERMGGLTGGMGLPPGMGF
jgi:DNA-binding YbaB/EbfC family protein